MAELEIHHEGEPHDPVGKKVGILAACLAVFLAIVTILSHRTHTEAIIKKSESNDEWAHYQASRIKYHNLELGERLTALMVPLNPAAKTVLDSYPADKKKYDAQFKVVFDAIRQLMSPPAKPKREIGFHVKHDDDKPKAKKR